MSEERMQILRMLADGKINAEEAEQLLSTVEQSQRPSPSHRKFLRVRVVDGEDTKVNVNIPISLAKMALRFLPAKILEQYPELDFDALVQEIEAGAEGKLVEVNDGDTSVEILVG
ncbi:MAG: SHOCT-like domain-containing protein [Limnochordia bacterium]|jgi:hypothetical protein